MIRKKHKAVDRYLVISIIFIFFLCVIVIRLFYLQIIKNDYYLTQAQEQHFGSTKIPAKRGEILVQDPSSQDYYKLATNITLDLLYADPFLITNERDVASKLAPFILEALCTDKKQAECAEKVKVYVTPSSFDENPIEKKAEVKEIKTQEALQKDVENFVYTLLSEKEIKKVMLKNFFSESQDNETLKAKVQAYGFNGIYVTKTAIYADPTQIRNKEEAAKALAEDLGYSQNDLEAKLIRRPSRYVPLFQKFPLQFSEKVKALNIEGIVLLPEHWRFYPEKELASSVVGFLDYAGAGQYGIEGRFDSLLRGVEGEIESANDLLGRNLVISKGTIRSAQDGSSVVLTIDRVVQSKVEQVLAKAVEDSRANSGQVVIMDPFTGNIIAMATYPSFNPNTYADAYKTKEISFDPGKSMTIIKQLGDNKYLTYENKFGPGVFVNHTISSAYESGSIFKPITVASGIDTEEITPDTRYNDTGELEVDEFTIHNVSQECLGYNTMVHALNYSCNIGMASISKKLGKSLFYYYITRFGFGERTDIELDGEAKGVVPYFRNWASSNLATISFGQGISVTPLQMVTAFSAIANGGILLQPRIVKEVIHPDGVKEKKGVEVVRRVISKSTADTLTAMLISSVDHGMAKNGRLKNYFVAGKTGTAQIPKENAIGFEEGEGTTIGSYIGYAPANNPKFVMIVKIDRPKSSQWADSTAAPAFREIAAFLMNYYNLPPDRAD